MRLGGGSVCACLRYQRCMLALSWVRAISASIGVRWGTLCYVFVGESRSFGRFVGEEYGWEGLLLCAVGMLGFGRMVDSDEFMRGF